MIINLTNHPINLLMGDSGQIISFPPSPQSAIVGMEDKIINKKIQHNQLFINAHIQKYSKIVNLPAESKGIDYIVPTRVFNALKAEGSKRKDIFVADYSGSAYRRKGKLEYVIKLYALNGDF